MCLSLIGTKLIKMLIFNLNFDVLIFYIDKSKFFFLYRIFAEFSMFNFPFVFCWILRLSTIPFLPFGYRIRVFIYFRILFSRLKWGWPWPKHINRNLYMKTASLAFSFYVHFRGGKRPNRLGICG